MIDFHGIERGFYGLLLGCTRKDTNEENVNKAWAQTYSKSCGTAGTIDTALSNSTPAADPFLSRVCYTRVLSYAVIIGLILEWRPLSSGP